MVSIIKSYLYKPLGVAKTLVRSLRRVFTSTRHKRIFLLNIPSHGNLGDHLISVVEQVFLKEHFPDRQVVLISSAEIFFSTRIALLDVRKDDTLCVTGGGFLGSRYDEENRFLKIVQRYPNNRIVFFPQSIYYDSTRKAARQLLKASTIYCKHKDLFFFARETNTFALLSDKLMPRSKGRIFLAPDIALYKHFPREETRIGVLWCIRKDAETNAGNVKIIESIQKSLSEKNIVQYYSDTYVPLSIPLEIEKEYVENKIKEFSSVKLVITDRLHGMIYSVITDTPVIALDNNTKKVSQVFQLWLKDVHSARFISDEALVEQTIEDLLNTDYPHYDNSKLIEYLRPIVDAIKA